MDFNPNKPNTISQLVTDHLPSVYNFVYRLVGNSADASDISQEVFIKVWKNLTKYDPEKNFKPWLFTIARNTTLDWLRKRKNISFSEMNKEPTDDFGATIADTAPLPDELFSRKELAETLETILEKISTDDRTIILLHHTEELTFAEIATILNKPLNTVKSRYRRALLTLRTQLTNAPK